MNAKSFHHPEVVQVFEELSFEQLSIIEQAVGNCRGARYLYVGEHVDSQGRRWARFEWDWAPLVKQQLRNGGKV